MSSPHGPSPARDAHADDRPDRHPAGYADERWVRPFDPAHGSAHPRPAAPEAPGPVRPAPVPPRWIRLRCGDTSIEIEWPEAAPSGAAPAVPGAAPVAAVPGEQSAEPDGGRRYVSAPMVGTFYHAPEVGAKPFVSVGDTVHPGQTVGILEVMKMMNTVTAEVSGLVVEVLVADAQPVEYQEPLLVIDTVGADPDVGADDRPGGSHNRH
ncbi:acetyl-CoA carboxylase biotin carboxyl carrier protein [Embleya sp. MST-111070]|uniref:acetyl-CoA carboxylase biotin carboxyl carrier protein n=1 Tax=Embleya sp. MST-111070 TaxID=3398231 RepID=UPI003F73AC2C